MKTNNKISTALFLIFFLASNLVYAAQIHSVAPNMELEANISPYNFNRISLIDGSIDSLETTSSNLEIKRKDNGEIFVSSSSIKSRPDTVFITSNSGATFTLNLKANRNLKTGQQIFLLEQGGSKNFNNIYDSYRDSLIAFYKSLHSGKPQKDYTYSSKTEKSKLKKLKLKKIITFSSTKKDSFIGEVFEVTNRSKDRFIQPQDFYKKNILAIKLDSHFLKKGEKTKLYLISTKEG